MVPPPVATFTAQPPSVAIDETENADAIALRSAISLLQLQREKSKRDLKALEELRAAAVQDPKGFARAVQNQRAHAAKTHNDTLSPTLSGLSDAAQRELEGGDDDDDDDDEKHRQHGNGARKDSAAVDDSTDKVVFPAIPQPQNVIRCPPVNWAKYHIVGEPLDRMHEEQKRYPGCTEPPRTQQGTRAPPHAVAAPYSPFTDGIGRPHSTSQPPKTFKKSPSKLTNRESTDFSNTKCFGRKSPDILGPQV